MAMYSVNVITAEMGATTFEDKPTKPGHSVPAGSKHCPRPVTHHHGQARGCRSNCNFNQTNCSGISHGVHSWYTPNLHYYAPGCCRRYLQVQPLINHHGIAPTCSFSHCTRTRTCAFQFVPVGCCQAQPAENFVCFGHTCTDKKNETCATNVKKCNIEHTDEKKVEPDIKSISSESESECVKVDNDEN